MPWARNKLICFHEIIFWSSTEGKKRPSWLRSLTSIVSSWARYCLFKLLISPFRSSYFNSRLFVILKVIASRPRLGILNFVLSVFDAHCEACMGFYNTVIIKIVISRARNVLIFGSYFRFDTHTYFGAVFCIQIVVFSWSGDLVESLFVSIRSPHLPSVFFVCYVCKCIVISRSWWCDFLLFDLRTLWSFGHRPSRWIPKRTHISFLN